MTSSKFARGSEWREWDFHIHSPASFHWSGAKFSEDEAANAALVDQMISALNSASPAAFALQDYFTFDGWFALKKRLAQQGAPTLEKRLFPGIELRIAAPMKGRLNAHVIFSDEINDQYLRDFLSALRLELINQPLSPNALREYARKCGADQLTAKGFKKTEVKSDDAIALTAGYKLAEINVESYKEAIKNIPNDLGVGFMPFTTSDGLNQIDWQQHYAFALGLFQSSPIFETRNFDTWAAFAGIQTDGNKDWIDAFQSALLDRPRLAVSGSDAHQFVGVTGNNNARGYGQFPVGKGTWIKADPTWKGLLQAIKEPAKRSHLGDLPPKLEIVQKNKSFYIDRVTISKIDGSGLEDPWLDGTSVVLNADLVAIIGNKGSGKSALADIIALLGQSQQREHFSFLRRDRFRGRNGEPSKHFDGQLNWLSGLPSKGNLNDDPLPEKVELVRYIPQGRFENLCNDHTAGRSNAFEKELRAVIFSHVPSEVRLGALDFEQLIEAQEEGTREELNELRKQLGALNGQIVNIEDQLNPSVKANLTEQIALKLHQLNEAKASEPPLVDAPSEEPTDDQKAATLRLAAVDQELVGVEASIKANAQLREGNGRQQRAIKNILDRIKLLHGQYQEFLSASAADFSILGIKPEDVALLTVKRQALDGKAADITIAEIAAASAAEGFTNQQAALQAEKTDLVRRLNEPQQRHQKYLSDKAAWVAAIAAIEGTPTQPESKLGLEARLAQIAELPQTLQQKAAERKVLSGKIFDVLSGQRDTRARLFSPVQKLIQNNSLIRDAYKLQFQANLLGVAEDIASDIFSLVKQNIGELRGEDESIAAVKLRCDKYHLNVKDDALSLADDLYQMLMDAAQKGAPTLPGLRSLMRKEKDPVEVYNYIFGLQYIEPKYTLLFQDTEIQQLSPGQRGALLLIFYLLVDKGRNPIVLDQPEENLDNETVVSLLVPVLNEAKKSRQIIMVTHNPNLAVVCDAEQIIHAKLDRKDGSCITYVSGSIEDGVLNKAVVDILEGTKIAFDNRGDKYH